MKKIEIIGVGIIAFVFIVLMVVSVRMKPAVEARPAMPPASTAEKEVAVKPEPKLGCPVQVTGLSINKPGNGYTYVRATIRNLTKTAISAISFEAYRADAFGDQFEPYNTSLTSERGIPAKGSRAMSWEILMDESTGGKVRPRSGSMSLYRIMFADGRSLDSSEVDKRYEGCLWRSGQKVETPPETEQ
jgi:hypothetical protein